MRGQRGFTLIELMVSSAVTFITVLAVSAAFVGYTRSFYTQAGIRGGQASLRQTHLMVLRNLRMAGYGIEPPLAFDFPSGWSRDNPASINRSDRLVFRMRDPAFNATVGSLSSTAITLSAPLNIPLRGGQILQVMCPGAIGWTYAQLSSDAPKGSTALALLAPNSVFPRLNNFTPTCFSGAAGAAVSVFKVDVYDYSIRLIDDDGDPSTPGRPYLFRRHGLDEKDPTDNYGEPVAEDIEAMRVSFVRENGTTFIPNPADPAPDYSTALSSELRANNNPANIRAVVIGLVARSSTRDQSAAPGTMNQIPPFGRKPDGTPEPSITLDGSPGTVQAAGFRRILSEMTVQVRNMRSAEMPMPIYTLDTTTPGACKGTVPSDNFNCAGG